jgi:predicted GNAT family acetyltransferase
MPKYRQKGSDKILEAFLRTLRNWDGKNPSFQDLVVGAVTQTATLRERTKQDVQFARDMALQLNVTESYVKGWISGRGLPNDALAKTFINEIRIYLEKHRVPATEKSN